MVYLSALLRGSEMWTTLTKYESRITGAEMRCIRKCMGKTSRERIRNSQIRGKLNQEPINKWLTREK
jgi:hypothetical protein